MSKNQWCDNCAQRIAQPFIVDGKLCCSFCGRVVCEEDWSEEVTFVKDAAGQSRAAGTRQNLDSGNSVSRDRILKRAYEDMDWIMLSVCNEENREYLVRAALAFYTIAVERNFTRGREKELVEAACLYLACREKEKPYLLIDFAEYLGRNVYELGAVYLLLCKLLSLGEHPIVQKPVDPSFFIHRFAGRLLGENSKKVADTALKIIASMKRDWMQTGRKPSGLCGAALYISALSFGHKYTKSHIVRIVHVCEATLTKRLIEFENTESGSLTIEEFIENAKELEKELRSTKQSATGSKVSEGSELLCEHKGSGRPVLAHGLCGECYDVFINLSGGLEGGSEPPAFQRAQQERMEKEHAEENADDSGHDTIVRQRQNNSKYLNFEKELDILEASRDENLQFTEGESIGAATKHVAVDDGVFDKLHGVDVASEKAFDESETLSDIDDIEVAGYIHNEEEKQYKKIIWEELNREYIEEQAAKEAAAAAAKEAYEANLRNCPEGMEAAQELAAAAAAAAIAKSRKERQQKRATEARTSTPAQTAAEATRQMLSKKRLDRKINYDVLEKLFDESVAPKNPKKSRIDNVLHNSKEELESEDRNKDLKLRSEDEYEDAAGDLAGGYAGDLHYENVDEGYDYNGDYEFEGY